MNRVDRLTRYALGASALAALCLTLAACGTGSSTFGKNAVNALGSGGQEFTFGALSGRAVLSNPPVTTNGQGVAITGLKGDISSLTLEDPSPNLAETRVVFHSYRDGNYEIYTMNTDGTNQIRLTNNTVTDELPSWQPDGKKILFDSNRDGNFEIYTMNADGTGPARLTNDAGWDFAASWSPDGAKIVFVSNRDTHWEIYTMNADGSNPTKLTSSATGNFAPSWSPDSQKIVFYSLRDGNTEIYTMNADGSNQTRLTNNPELDTEPSWSPDGSRIAFASYRDSNWEIYTMSRDGYSPTRLTNTILSEHNPTWSPDGSKILFTSDRAGGNELYTMNADGAGQVQLTTTKKINDCADWSPFVKQRKLIGSGGALSTTNVAGFLFARGADDNGTSSPLGTVVNSIVAFDGSPRSGVQLSSSTGLNQTGQILTYAIEADSPNTITRLSYLNNPDYFKPIKTVGPGTSLPSANGVLVDFSSQTGKVTAVLPYTGTRAAGSAGKPVVKEENGQRVYRGAFAGVFDATGKNLAPQGAREVRFDSITGKFLQAQ